MKIKTEPTALERPGSGLSGSPDSDHAATRTRVVRSLVVEGPATAVALGDRLGLTPGAVRRHLDALLEDGLIRSGERAPYGPTAPRGRGRPARVYSVTEQGRLAGGPSDDHLATEVLRYLRASGGQTAVREFARGRLADQQVRYAKALDGVPFNERPAALADLLTDEGFAATAEPVPGAAEGVQLCQHHCPVAAVAAEFGEFCDAEAEMFADLLGTHVRRLATLAHGDGVCTTHLVASAAAPPESNPPDDGARQSDGIPPDPTPFTPAPALTHPPHRDRSI